MKAVVFDRHGDPAEVLHVREMPVPEPSFGQVRVRMLAAPINPSDLLTIEGRYSKVPQLPAMPGYEGVGIVEKTGGGVLGWLRRGKRVAVISAQGGTWSEYCIVNAKHVVPMPDAIPDDQAAMFFVNPITAVAMVRSVLAVPPGEFLLQSAAGSALGQMVIQLGKKFGFRTINVVRRSEQARELRPKGGDVWVSEADGPIVEQVLAATGGQGVRFAIECVGGATGSAIVKCLGLRGRCLVYGLLSGEPIQLDPRQMISQGCIVEGFWLAQWLPRQGIARTLRLFRQVKRLMREGILRSDIAAVYEQDQITQAMRHVQQAARGGKILLRIARA